MTKREAAIVSAYTGYLIGEFSDFHAYVEEIMGRPVFTHELPNIAEELKEKSKKDFMSIKIEENDMAVKEKDNELIIDIPKDGGYIDILGHRIYRNGRWNKDSEDSWIAFLEYLQDCEKAKKENEMLKSKLNQKEKSPEWLYHTLFENCSRVDFDIIEKALGFRLFGWQKDYIITGCAYAGRRTGKTTSEILHQLLSVDEEPIDFSKPAQIKQIAIIRQYYRDIWEKLHDAGIPMRPVFWSKKDKEFYKKGLNKFDPYKYAREAFTKYEADNHNHTCSDCSQFRYDRVNGIYHCSRRAFGNIYQAEEMSACDDFEKGEQNDN